MCRAVRACVRVDWFMFTCVVACFTQGIGVITPERQKWGSGSEILTLLCPGTHTHIHALAHICMRACMHMRRHACAHVGGAGNNPIEHETLPLNQDDR